MSKDFIRYSPDIDPLPANFAKNLDVVLKSVEQYVRGSPSTEPTGKPEGRAIRSAHAKQYGLAQGEIEILGGLPTEYAQGIYATPSRHGALVRFSNGSPHLGMDSRLPLAMGLGVKIFDIEGPTLLDDEADSRTFDYANINAPIFFCNTLEQYLFIHQLNVDQPTYFAKGKAGRNQFYSDFITGKGSLPPDKYIWDEFLAFLAVSKLPSINLLLSSYWTMGAVRHGEYIAKIRFAPAPDSAKLVVQRVLDLPRPPREPKDVFRQALVAELQARPYEFDIQVQLSKDLDLMPIHNVTVEWSEQLSPFVTVAKLTLPRQDISRNDNLETVDALSFTPWRVTAEHAPLGDIQRVRKEAYRHSSMVRHQVNRQERREPRSPDEVLT